MSGEWDELNRKVSACRGCSLCETRTNIVFEDGNRKSKIMLVGEGPGRSEDEQGVPFVGAAGKLLDNYLLAVGLKRSDVYIANVIKCRPPQNRDPKPEEQASCGGFLYEQIELVAPKIIVCLGRIAAKFLISDDFAITRDCGRWYESGGVLLTAVFHPAALLRDENKKEQELRCFMEICEKAREIGALK